MCCVSRPAPCKNSPNGEPAGAYAFGIAKNHAFLDGNKRTAWACGVLFLKVNGIELRVPAMEAVESIVALATGELTESAFAVWLRG
jgi:death-on-curing protein